MQPFPSRCHLRLRPHLHSRTHECTHARPSYACYCCTLNDTIIGCDDLTLCLGYWGIGRQSSIYLILQGQWCTAIPKKREEMLSVKYPFPDYSFGITVKACTLYNYIATFFLRPVCERKHMHYHVFPVWCRYYRMQHIRMLHIRLKTGDIYFCWHDNIVKNDNTHL